VLKTSSDGFRAFFFPVVVVVVVVAAAAAAAITIRPALAVGFRCQAVGKVNDLQPKSITAMIESLGQKIWSKWLTRKLQGKNVAI